jgi:hypothetical protein
MRGSNNVEDRGEVIVKVKLKVRIKDLMKVSIKFRGKCEG